MDGLGKKVGYLKGLMEGMDFSSNPSMEKLMAAMVDLLADLCDHAEMQDELLDELNDYVESIDDDLAALEGDDGFHEMDDDVEEEIEDAYMNGMEDIEDHLHLLGGHADDEDDTETLAGAICPECRRLFFVGADDPEDAEYTCPHCSGTVVPEPLTSENAPIAHPKKD